MLSNSRGQWLPGKTRIRIWWLLSAPSKENWTRSNLISIDTWCFQTGSAIFIGSCPKTLTVKVFFSKWLLFSLISTTWISASAFLDKYRKPSMRITPSSIMLPMPITIQRVVLNWWDRRRLPAYSPMARGPRLLSTTPDIGAPTSIAIPTIDIRTPILHPNWSFSPRSRTGVGTKDAKGPIEILFGTWAACTTKRDTGHLPIQDWEANESCLSMSEWPCNVYNHRKRRKGYHQVHRTYVNTQYNNQLRGPWRKRSNYLFCLRKGPMLFDSVRCKRCRWKPNRRKSCLKWRPSLRPLYML